MKKPASEIVSSKVPNSISISKKKLATHLDNLTQNQMGIEYDYDI